jgi:hypothetical protein
MTTGLDKYTRQPPLRRVLITIQRIKTVEITATSSPSTQIWKSGGVLENTCEWWVSPTTGAHIWACDQAPCTWENDGPLFYTAYTARITNTLVPHLELLWADSAERPLFSGVNIPGVAALSAGAIPALELVQTASVSGGRQGQTYNGFDPIVQQVYPNCTIEQGLSKPYWCAFDAFLQQQVCFDAPFFSLPEQIGELLCFTPSDDQTAKLSALTWQTPTWSADFATYDTPLIGQTGKTFHSCGFTVTGNSGDAPPRQYADVGVYAHLREHLGKISGGITADTAIEFYDYDHTEYVPQFVAGMADYFDF